MAIGINWADGVWLDATWEPGVWLDSGVLVPDVVGETQAAGTTTLETALFVVSVQTAYSSVVAAGLIISQSPIGGVEVSEGSTVTITVSLGPEPESTNRGAGRPKRKRRYFVEIDGQEFDVDSIDEAKLLLDKAKALAKQVVTEARQSVIVKPGLKVPQIRTPHKELVPVIQQARKEIRDIYAEIKRDLEIRSLMLKAEEDEEEAIIRLLM